MARKGWKFAGQPETTPAPNDDGLSSTPGAAPNEAWVLAYVRRVGFNLAATHPPDSPAMRRYRTYLRGLTSKQYEQAFQALVGNTRHHVRILLPGHGGYDVATVGGCQGAAQRAVYGSVAANDVRINGVLAITLALADAANKNPTVTRAALGYQRCIHRLTGHYFTSPTQTLDWVRAKVAKNRDEMPLSAQYAVASTRCQYTSGQADAYAQAYWHAAQAMPESWYEGLKRIDLRDQQAAAKARSVLNSR